MTPEEVSRILALFSGAFQRRVEPETTTAYMLALSEEPYEPFARGAKDLLAKSEFFPTIAALHRAAERHRAPVRPVCALCGAPAVASLRSKSYCGAHHREALVSWRADPAGPSLPAPVGQHTVAEVAKAILAMLKSKRPSSWNSGDDRRPRG